MADAQNTYTAPPDFAGRQTGINTAYNTSLAQLKFQQDQLYNQMGYKGGGSIDPTTGIVTPGSQELDTNNQYGSIQQLLHSAGQSLIADDGSEHRRGLNSDGGLGAQRARLVRYQMGSSRNTLGQQFDGTLADIGTKSLQALNTKNTDQVTLGEDRANWQSGQNAQADAVANYNKLLAAMQTPAAPTQAAMTNQAPLGAIVGYNPLAPQNRASNVVPKPSVKAGKVTTASGLGHY